MRALDASLFSQSRRSIRSRIAVVSLLALSSFSMESSGESNQPVWQEKKRPGFTKPVKRSGGASWYGPGFHGKRTASGERFNQHALTAAHRSLPLGTQAVVTNLSNGKKVKVRINDRGPFAKGRLIDLSFAAARQLGMVNSGAAKVSIEVAR